MKIFETTGTRSKKEAVKQCFPKKVLPPTISK